MQSLEMVEPAGEISSTNYAIQLAKRTGAQYMIFSNKVHVAQCLHCSNLHLKATLYDPFELARGIYISKLGHQSQARTSCLSVSCCIAMSETLLIAGQSSASRFFAVQESVR
jgi:hypothetical protein